jgi:squalene synthase HpnC
VSVGHYENFPVASRLVPAALRPAVVAIYRFARSADDIADEGDASAHERLAALADYDAALEAIGRGETPRDPPFFDLAHAIRAHGLPIALFHALISAFRQDVTTKRYATYADVLSYCSRSANPVGRLLLALYRRESEENLRCSDAICTGLQLTNFWQDVAIDWKKDRVYLPQEDLERFGVTLADIAEGRMSERLRALIFFETSRTRALLESGRPLTKALPWRLGLELSAVIAGGQRILSRIESAGGNVFQHRPVLGTRDWAVVAYRSVFS